MNDYNPIYGVNANQKQSNNDTFDFQMPDIPEPPQEEKIEPKDRDAVGFKFGFIGAGQGGGKLAETFSQIGYGRVGVINTADQDLATINVPNKLKFGEQQGAGKNREIAKQAFLSQKEDVVDFLIKLRTKDPIAILQAKQISDEPEYVESVGLMMS